MSDITSVDHRSHLWPLALVRALGIVLMLVSALILMVCAAIYAAGIFFLHQSANPLLGLFNWYALGGFALWAAGWVLHEWARRRTDTLQRTRFNEAHGLSASPAAVRCNDSDEQAIRDQNMEFMHDPMAWPTKKA